MIDSTLPSTQTPDQFILSKCLSDDLPSVFNMVKQLAIFEKEPDAVIATLDDYTQAFNENLIQVIVAKSEGTVVGMVLFYLTFSTWKGRMMYLEDFYVVEDFRKLGVGQLLFDAFLTESKAQDCKLVKWQVLDWNEIGLNFYHKNNAIIEKNWWNGKIIF